MTNSNSADISVFEGLQANANASMGAGSTSHMSVFNSIEDVKKAVAESRQADLDYEKAKEFYDKERQRLRDKADALGVRAKEMIKKIEIAASREAKRVFTGLKANPGDARLRRDLEELKKYETETDIQARVVVYYLE